MSQATEGVPYPRLITLAGGSNFRDLGGYQSEDGRFVRWRCLFRSGAFGQLTSQDLVVLRGLNVRTILELRCREERELAPSRWVGPSVCSIDYPQETVFAKALGSEAWQLYEAFLDLLSGHLRLLFDALRQEATPLVINCSGGQDRTGFVTAMTLSALGISREQIAQDYMLSTASRRRVNEVNLDRVRLLAATNPVAAFYARQVEERGAESLDPKPLLDNKGRPKIMLAFDLIDARWGGVLPYLSAACNVSTTVIAAIRERYLTSERSPPQT